MELIVFLEIKNTSFVSTVKYLNELSEDATFNNIEVEQNKLPISEEQLENAKNKSILDVASECGYSF